MKSTTGYTAKREFTHQDPETTGILLLNLGTPDAPTTAAVRTYLREFLSDPRIIEPPPSRWLWWLILNGIILNIRPRRSAEAYRLIWDSVGQGSPLLYLTQQLAESLCQSLAAQFSTATEVEVGMTYGNPSIRQALERLREKHVQRLLVVPLFPQYSATTTASCLDKVFQQLQSWRRIPEMRVVAHYHKNPHYIDAVANSIRKHQQTHGKPQLLILSYHGLPKRYLVAGDPYHCECLASSRLIAAQLGLQTDDYLVTFQSRFGKEAWLQPYIEETLATLPAKGVKNVQVICPGFAVDCLETLEEIAIRNGETFTEAGGETYSYIPALNDGVDHLNALQDVILQHTTDWRQQNPSANPLEEAVQRQARASRAGAHF